MQATKSYKAPKRAPPTVFDPAELPPCSHTFGSIWQKLVWMIHPGNLPTTSVHKYQTCSACGFVRQVE